MAEDVRISEGTREEQYRQLLPQIKALLTGEQDIIANLANLCAALKYGMEFFWVGFYLVKGNELVLGPFQGPIACTRISRGKGVCGTAWARAETIIVPNVDQFPGHIACSLLTKSEIVVPLKDAGGNVWAVLDIDSDKLNDFDKGDAEFLNKVCALINR